MHVVTCPKCQRKFKVPKLVTGVRMKCSACGQSFVGSSTEVAGSGSGPIPLGPAAVEAGPSRPQTARPAPVRSSSAGPVALIVCCVGAVGIIAMLVALVWIRRNPREIIRDAKTGQVISNRRTTIDDAKRRAAELEAVRQKTRQMRQGQRGLPPAGPSGQGDPAGLVDSPPPGPGPGPSLAPAPAPVRGDPKLVVSTPALISAGAVGSNSQIACGRVRSHYSVGLATVRVSAYIGGQDVQRQDFYYIPAGGEIRYSLTLPPGQVDTSGLTVIATARAAGSETLVWEVSPDQVQRTDLPDGSTAWKGRTRNRAGVPVTDVRIYLDYYDSDGVWGGHETGQLDAGVTLGKGKVGFFTITSKSLKASFCDSWTVRLAGKKY